MNGPALVVVLAVAALGQPASAQDPGSRPTREYVQAAAQSDQFEILEAQAVLAASKDPHVRSFAQQMMQAHMQTARTLGDATARAGLTPPPPGINGDQAQMLGTLQNLTGSELDRTYLRQQAFAHRSALTVNQAYAASGDTRPVREAASAAVPLIASHLAMVEQLQSNRSEQ